MRRRILLALILVMTLTTVILFIPAAIALQSAERHEQEVDIQNEAYAAEDQLGTNHAITPVEDHSFAIYDKNDQLVSGDGPAVGDRAVQIALKGAPAITTTGGMIVASAPSEGGGAVRAAESTSEADERAFSAELRLAGLAAGLMAMAIVVAVILSKRLSRPIVALANSANRLGSGDFTIRVDPSGLAEADDVANALNSAAGRLGKLVHRERALTADLSHQLRTPLAGMRVAVESELVAPRADSTQILTEVISAVDRMETAIAELIALQREAKPSGVLVDVGQLAHAAADRWRATAGAQGRDITVGCPSRSALMPIRAVAVDTAMDVLLDNAIVHGSGTIHIDLDVHEGLQRVTVADQGSFTPDAARDPFARRVQDSQHGIGLSLALSVIEAEEGTIDIVNNDPTTFAIVLPLVASLSAAG